MNKIWKYNNLLIESASTKKLEPTLEKELLNIGVRKFNKYEAFNYRYVFDKYELNDKYAIAGIKGEVKSIAKKYGYTVKGYNTTKKRIYFCIDKD